MKAGNLAKWFWRYAYLVSEFSFKHFQAHVGLVGQPFDAHIAPALKQGI